MHQRLLAVAIAILVLGALGCRSRDRSSKVATGTVEVLIRMKNIEEVDKTKAVNLAYNIRCNGNQDAGGVVKNEEKMEYAFQVKNIKVGDPCIVSVISQQARTDIVYLRGDKIMYETSQPFPISTLAGGGLGGEALLQRSYKVNATASLLKVPVRFKDTMPKDSDLSSLFAELKCIPEFEGLAKGLTVADAKTKRGVFIFDSGLKPGVSFQCRQIQITQGSDKSLFYGDLQKVFEYKDGVELTAEEVELQLVEITNAQGIVIVTTPGDACKSDEYFDVDTRSCRKNK